MRNNIELGASVKICIFVLNCYCYSTNKIAERLNIHYTSPTTEFDCPHS